MDNLSKKDIKDAKKVGIDVLQMSPIIFKQNANLLKMAWHKDWVMEKMWEKSIFLYGLICILVVPILIMVIIYG